MQCLSSLLRYIYRNTNFSIMLAAVGATLLPFLGAVPGRVITRRNIDSWYRHIKKPSWRPPNWAFGPSGEGHP
jgi:tryptophan-rich sensory protein